MERRDGEVRRKPLLLPAKAGPDVPRVVQQDPPGALTVLDHGSKWHVVAVQGHLQPMAGSRHHKQWLGDACTLHSHLQCTWTIIYRQTEWKLVGFMAPCYVALLLEGSYCQCLKPNICSRISKHTCTCTHTHTHTHSDTHTHTNCLCLLVCKHYFHPWLSVKLYTHYCHCLPSPPYSLPPQRTVILWPWVGS